jgi:hypothetical protein
MTAPIRTERRFGVTAELSASAVANLFVLRNSQTWDDMLDVLEQCCIEVETLLINTPAEDEKAVLANHKMSKAAWMVFTHMQEKVDYSVALYLSRATKEPVVPPLTDEERERENILNPLNSPPDADDYYGTV